MLDPDGDTHLYLQITEVIRTRVAHLPPGSQVPSEAEIVREFGVARATARRAIRVLRDEGLVHTVRGTGTFVGSPGHPIHEDRRPIYRQIADDLTHKIRAGCLQPGRPIPGEKALVEEYTAARETVRHAIALLREQGWIYTVAARGSYVSPRHRWP